MAARVDQQDVELLWKIMDKRPGIELTVDLGTRTVTAGDVTVPFDIDDYTRWRLMEGLDDIGLTLRKADAISDFEERRPAFAPVTTPR